MLQKDSSYNKHRANVTNPPYKSGPWRGEEEKEDADEEEDADGEEE
jgi:hypothetical protein